MSEKKAPAMLAIEFIRDHEVKGGTNPDGTRDVLESYRDGEKVELPEGSARHFINKGVAIPEGDARPEGLTNPEEAARVVRPGGPTETSTTEDKPGTRRKKK